QMVARILHRTIDLICPHDPPRIVRAQPSPRPDTMEHHRIRRGVTASVLTLAGATALTACGHTPPKCPAGNEVCGVCAGVPVDDVCNSDTCTAGVMCLAVIDVPDNAALAAALQGASAKSCIALAPGNYGEIELPGGVSLLGRSAASVDVVKVTVGAGDG